MSKHQRSGFSVAAALLLALATLLPAQQPNSTAATLNWNGFTGPPYPISATAVPGGSPPFVVYGSPFKNYAIVYAPAGLQAGAMNTPFGHVDLNLSGGYAFVADGIGGNSFLDHLAEIDITGSSWWYFPIPSDATGSLGAIQVLVEDPTSGAGYTLTAAIGMTIGAIYVSATTGLPGNPGTEAAPVDTVAAGLALANLHTPPWPLRLTTGSYSGNNDLSGVNVYGGYDPVTWHEQIGGLSTLNGFAGNPVHISGNTSLALHSLAFVAPPGPTASSIGLIMANGSGATFVNCHFTAVTGPAGAAGSNATPGLAGASGVAGVNGAAGTGTSAGGAGGSGGCGSGGHGGISGSSTTAPAAGASGTAGGAGCVAIAGGAGGAAGAGGLLCNPAPNAPPGQAGAAGTNGAAGTGGSGGAVAGQLWVTANGTSGSPGTNGACGGGGGGGAGAGGICSNSRGGGGGGGGGGGFGGSTATGGGGGGASIAVLMIGANGIFIDCAFQTGAGGNGGPGGNGTLGGSGGAGGAGGSTPTGLGGNGGAGGAGGQGGFSGGGGGGAGGHCIGILRASSSTAAQGGTNTFILGTPGAGGAGGVNGDGSLTSSTNGSAGNAIQVL